MLLFQWTNEIGRLGFGDPFPTQAKLITMLLISGDLGIIGQEFIVC